MSEAKKATNAKRITVTPADESSAGEATKPLIVNRPILKAPGLPMATDESTDATASAGSVFAGTAILKPGGKPSLKPLASTTTPASADKAIADGPADHPSDKAADTADSPTNPPAEATTTKPEDKPEKSESDADKAEAEGEQSKTPPEEQLSAEAEAQAKHGEAIQKLVDSKQYFLPINAVEKRKTKHFVVLGVVLSLFLLVAWGDIALDAGLIQIPGVKPVTHFFSN